MEGLRLCMTGFRTRKVNGQKVAAGREYSVEIVSPILTYEKTLNKEMVRKNQKGRRISKLNGRIHIHLDGADHTPSLETL